MEKGYERAYNEKKKTIKKQKIFIDKKRKKNIGARERVIECQIKRT